jgi:hypothetical protein
LKDLKKTIINEVNKNLFILQNDIKDISKRVAFFVQFKDIEYRDYHLNLMKENLIKDTDSLERGLRILRDVVENG